MKLRVTVDFGGVVTFQGGVALATPFTVAFQKALHRDSWVDRTNRPTRSTTHVLELAERVLAGMKP